MKKSAMALAFQTLRRKPMVLLLLLPAPVMSVLVSAISLQTMPDLSKLFDMNYMMDYANSMEGMQASSMMNAISMLVSSVSFVISAVSLFLLVPPAMELLADGAAGVETEPGWFLRGLRRHWWKPITDGAITGGIYTVLVIPLGIIFYIILMAVAFSSMGFVSSTNFSASPEDAFNSLLSGVMPIMLISMGIFALVIEAVRLVVYSIFGLFLPAMADRSFGEAFKLMFSKKGFRKLPRMIGGQLLIALVPGAFYLLLAVAYLVIKGMPGDPMGILAAMLEFMKSWAGILGMLVTSIIGVIIYPFRFGVHQLVRDEEEAELAQLNQQY